MEIRSLAPSALGATRATEVLAGHHLVFCVNGMLDRPGSVQLHRIRDGISWLDRHFSIIGVDAIEPSGRLPEGQVPIGKWTQSSTESASIVEFWVQYSIKSAPHGSSRSGSQNIPENEW